MKNRMINLIVLLLGCVAFLQVAEAGSTQNVSVVNTPSQPVPVSGTIRDADQPARQPFQDQRSAVFNDGSNAAGTANAPLTVPAGKRLVIEHVSMFGNMPVGQKVIMARVVTVVGGTDSGHLLIAIAQGTTADSNFEYSAVSQDIRLYADPGSNIKFFAERDSTAGVGVVSFVISGYLVNVP